MVHSVQASFFTRGRLYTKRNYPGNLYQVIVNTEEGEHYEYEVEADTFAKATEIAEGLANDLMTDITFIEVYNEEYF
jgi:hypothetical protein